jgi:hypothetical protein
MPVDLWTSTPFLDEATAWVAGHAEQAGLTLTGEREQPHARPWSSAIRFESDGGRLWFKVNGPGTRHEAALVGTLGRVVPYLVPELLAVDAERGWSLMRDAGPVMRTLADPDQLWTRWEQVLTAYAEAQLTLAAYLPELLAEGVEDLGPTALPGHARRMCDELAALPEDEGGLTPEDVRRVHDALPSYDVACSELAESGVPPSINHDDLHSSNICWGDVGPRIIDWGDAVVGHPFGTMLATLNSIGWHTGVAIDDPRVERVRDAYLEPFAAYGDLADRRHWVTLARRTGCVSRARSYVNAFVGEPREAQAAQDWPVRGWLLEIAEEP